MDELRVGPRLKALRQARGHTLRQVAATAGMTPGMLSKIENQHMSPTLPALARLAAALGTRLGPLFGEDSGYTGLVLRRKAEALAGLRRSRLTGYDYSLLAAEKSGRRLEPFLVRLRPGVRQRRHLHHGGDEFVYVLRGRLDFQWGRRRFLLRAGDSLAYDASVPHLSRNPDRRGETLLLAVASEADTRLRLGLLGEKKLQRPETKETRNCSNQKTRGCA
jgi:transcriptional regulator with XRE-family HTH domain